MCWRQLLLLWLSALPILAREPLDMWWWISMACKLLLLGVFWALMRAFQWLTNCAHRMRHGCPHPDFREKFKVWAPWFWEFMRREV